MKTRISRRPILNLTLVSLPLMLTMAACSSKIVKTDELAKVKRVAIVGLDLQQQKSVSAGDLASIALKQASSPQAQAAARVDSNHIEEVYKDLSHKIEAQTGWQVMKEQDVKRNPAYAKLFKEKTEGFQSRPMINDRFNLYAAPGILDSFAIITTKTDRLKELATALKVDAIVYATSTVNLNNSSLLMSMVGNGEFKPSANASVFVIDGHSGEKIFMNQAEGPKVSQGEKNALGMANDDKLNILAQQATAMSMDLILKELKR